MDVLYPCCCGVDVHQASVEAWLLRPGSGGVPAKEVRTFGTMTTDLLALVDWVVGASCTAVAMESTGSYWKPLYNLLEGVVEQVLVVNAAHITHVPGRKTDIKDAEWIADLLRHGLLRTSRWPDQRHLPRGAVSPPAGAQVQEARGRGRRASHPGHRLPYPARS